MQKNSERLGMFCAILSAVLFGTMPLFARTAYQYGSNAWSTAFARYLFGGVILLLFFAFSPGQTVRITPRQGRRLFLLSIFQAATPVLLYLSYNTIDSGLATTLHFTYPVMVILLMTLLRHVPLTRQKLLCTALCIAGVLCFYTPGERVGALGMALAVLSGLTFSLYILILGNSGLSSLPVLTATFWISIFAAAEIGALAFLLGELNLDVGRRGRPGGTSASSPRCSPLPSFRRGSSSAAR